MLEDLTIKDFALITSSQLEFGEGFTVLSGETGAGKSILIGALSFLLGGKADTKMIRSGAREASVSGTFTIVENETDTKGIAKNDDKEGIVEDEDMRPLCASLWLAEHGIETEDGRVLVRRTLKDSGKSAAWIGGVPVTRGDLSSFSALLVDIHGQHDHQLLMKAGEHRRFLDAIAGIEGEVKSFTALYAALVEKRQQIDKITADSKEREKEVAMLSFAIQEIEEAKLHTGEDEELSDEESRLSSYEKLCSSTEAVTEALAEAVAQLKTARKESARATETDKSLNTLDARLESSFYEINDIAEEFTSYKEHLVFDPARLEEVQERLSLIYNLKKKYAPSPSSPLSCVLDYETEAKNKLGAIESAGENKAQLQEEIKTLEKRVYSAAMAIRCKRKAAGEAMAKEVEKVLQHLGMSGTRFCVKVSDKSAVNNAQKCGPYGMDDVEFLISANLAAPLMPLAQIASGGELSRVMLALKTVIAERDPVPTLVFDEIDTGIGGEVAVAVGNHLSKLAAFKQILCITHLASIAVYADNQIKIEKAVYEGATVSSCREVKGVEREKEIARMLSGEESEEAVEHARAMLSKFSLKGA